jgi:hypothetical protein
MATYPNEVFPADSEIMVLDGTTDQRTGLPYVAKGTGPTSVPSYEVQFNRRLQRQNVMLEPWRRGMVVSEGNLKIGVYPIDYVLGGNVRYFAGATGVSIPDDSLKNVYIDSSGTLQTQDSWPSDLTTYMPLAIVSAAGGVLEIEDYRSREAFHVQQIEAGPDNFANVSLPDASGGSPQTVAIQVKDIQQNDLAETVYLVVSVHDAADGGSGFATDATIAVGANGTLIESLTADTELFCKTNASGQLDITVTDASSETVYLVTRPFRRSKLLDCSDIATVTIV